MVRQRTVLLTASTMFDTILFHGHKIAVQRCIAAATGTAAHHRSNVPRFPNSIPTFAAVVPSKRRKFSSNEESIADLNYRYSIVHAHPLGPWRAILHAVRDHYTDWEKKNSRMPRTKDTHDQLLQLMEDGNSMDDSCSLDTPPKNTCNNDPYNILDVACGPRGEPGTTIAYAIPKSNVHCIDSCSDAIDAVNVSPTNVVVPSRLAQRVMGSPTVASQHTTMSTIPLQLPVSIMQPPPLLSPPPPSNLIKSVCNLDHLDQHFAPNSMHVIVCCYGYGLSTNVLHALRQAYTVLAPGGVLILGTWQYSSLVALSHDILTTIRSGTGDSAAMLLVQHENDLDIGLPPLLRPLPTIEHSGPGEWESLLNQAGFHSSSTVSSDHTYPIDMGNTKNEQFNIGTLLVQSELHDLNAYDPYRTTTMNNILYKNYAEEAFWMNMSKYCILPPPTFGAVDPSYSDHNHLKGGVTRNTTTIWMPNNIFKLTVSTK
jgi:hypothetical protein